MDERRAGQVLAQLRQRSGLGVSELARRAKVSATTIVNYERGTRPNGDPFKPNPTVLLKVAAVFGPKEAAQLLASFGMADRQAGLPQGPAEPVTRRDYPAGSEFKLIGRAANDPRQLVFQDPNGEIVILVDEQGR